MTTNPLPAGSAVTAIPIRALGPADLENAGDETTRRWIAASGFKAKPGEVLLLPSASGDLASALFGLGDASDPFAAGKLATSLPPGIYQLAGGFADPRLAALAFALGGYRFTRYRTEPAT